ncbi:MAG: IS200/IS605 family transposase [Saprospiraceae bacterium]|nr:IS200/IS605 family transposase [Saprospiraceae bacterium]
MAHSRSKIWVHAILGVKHREALITSEIEQPVHDIVKSEFEKCNCVLDCLNGTTNHLHTLFLLHPDCSIRQVIKQVKGASSHAINRSDLMQQKFAWQVGFAAFSVSESRVPVIRAYISRQKEHHRKVSYEEEYKRVMLLLGLVLEFEE